MKPFRMEKAEIQGKPKLGDHLLHGDVILHKIESLPDKFEEMKTIEDGTLAEGELTHHYHRLFDGEYELKEDQSTQLKWLKVITTCYLRHQEHKEIEVPPGNYKIDIQREYDPWTKKIRRVAD